MKFIIQTRKELMIHEVIDIVGWLKYDVGFEEQVRWEMNVKDFLD